MKDIHIRLPEKIHDMLTRAAGSAGARPDDYATDILVEALLNSKPEATTPSEAPASVPPPPSSLQRDLASVSPARQTSTFSCAGRFPGASHLSIEWSQHFVDAALRYDGVTAFLSEGGIGFDPNFVFIERVYTQEEGFAASYYGSPAEFQHHGLTVEPGRNANYSRYKVKSPRDLDVAPGLTHQNWHRSGTATPGWSTRLACCFRRPAGNTARRLRKHTGFPNLCVFKSACRSQTHARRVSAASRRRQHASRVLHPEASARRHCDFDASALDVALRCIQVSANARRLRENA